MVSMQRFQSVLGKPYFIKQYLGGKGLEVADFGTASQESADYPDYAQAVARSVVAQDHDLGILICTTGIGMSIAANKIPGARAALAWTPELAALVRQHNNANVLCLNGKSTPQALAAQILEAFLNTQFESGGRHERRVTKLEEDILPAEYHLRTVDPAIAEFWNVNANASRRTLNSLPAKTLPARPSAKPRDPS